METLIKTADYLPANKMEWGNYILTKLNERLGEISSYIDRYQTVSSDDKGNALGVVVLQGNRAIIPAIIKNFKLLDMDVIVCTVDNNIQYKYLSKRSLFDLLTSDVLSLRDMRQTKGIYDNFINMFSPVGDNVGAGNPFFGLATKPLAKTSSLYFLSGLRELNLHDFCSIDINKTASMERPENFWGILTKSGSYYEYFDTETPEGKLLDENDFKDFLSVFDLGTRTKVANSLVRNDWVLFGNYYPHPGNIIMDFRTTKDRRFSPTEEGVYLSSEGETYVNPVVVDFDGIETGYKIAVTSGKYVIRKDVYVLPYSQNSAVFRSKEEMIPEIRELIPGKTYAFYDTRQLTISLPFKLLNLDTTDNVYRLNIKPLFMDDKPKLIEFYNGSVISKVNDSYSIFPRYYTKIVSIPEVYDECACSCEDEMHVIEQATKGLTYIDISTNGAVYTITEDTQDNIRGPFSEGRLGFELMRLYGLSPEQAKAIIGKLKFYLRYGFYVKKIFDEKGVLPKIKEDIPIEPQTKEAMDHLLGILSKLASYVHEENFKPSDYYLLNNTYNYLLKYAAANQPDNKEKSEAEDRADQNAMNMGGGFLMQSLMSSSPMTKILKNMIDKVLFYYNQIPRMEETIRLINRLEQSLKDAENYLGNCLLLIQLDKLPGQKYEHTRVLLSDIDNYLSQLLSSRIIIRGV